MPLIKSKSKQAFKKNIEAEMDAGKPQKQALAIAFSVKRRAPKKKMADGGEVRAASEQPSADERRKRSLDMLDSHEEIHSPELDERDEDMKRDVSKHDMSMLKGARTSHKPELDARDESRSSNSIDDSSDEMEDEMLDSHPRKHAAELRAASGMVDEDEEPSEGLSMVEQIMRKRKMYAKGGEVDIHDNAMETPGDRQHTPYFHDDEEAVDHDFDSTMDGMSQPEDSNMKTRELEDADMYDMVSQIRKKYNSKKRM